MCDRGSRWSGTRWVAGPRARCPTFSTTCWRRVSIRRTTSSRWPPRRRPSGGTSTATCCSRCSTCRRRNWTLALDTLCVQGVLEHRDTGQGQYRFRHELLREVAYELQPPSRRQLVHGKLADALTSAAVGDDVVDWGVVASHYERARRPGEASDAHARAASVARMRGAFAEARGYLDRAIELLTSDIDHDLERDLHEVRLRLQRGYLAVSEEGHASPAAAADYERCIELTAADPSGDEMFNTVIVLWTYHLIRGELAQCREISEFTYRSLDRREWYLIFNIAAFGILDCWEGDFRAARDLLELFNANRVPADEEQFLAEWFNPNEPVTVILTCVALVRFVMGDPAGADRSFVAAA